MLEVWHGVLLKPDHVRVFEYNGVLCWSDNVGFGRVPPGISEVEAGNTYQITSSDVHVVTKRFDMSRMVEALHKVEEGCRIKADNDIESSPAKVLKIKDETLNARVYFTKAKRHPIYIDERLHVIILSAVRRGADLYTTGDRLLVAAKIDGAIVAMAAAIKTKSDML